MKISQSLSLYRRLNIVALLVALCLFNASCSYFTKDEGPHKAFSQARTIAGLDREFGEPFGIAVKDGLIYVSDGETGKIFKIDSEGVPAVFAENLHTPSGIAFDKDGGLIVADTGSHTIKQIGSDGFAVTIAGAEGNPGFADGGANKALFSGPIGVAIDDEGRIYVADTYNDRIRVIEGGMVRTIAGSSRGFSDGSVTDALFDTPCGIAVLSGGRVLVADSGNGRLRLIDPAGTVSTLAGGGPGDIDDGFLSSSGFHRPSAFAVDVSGSVYLADGNAIRVIRNGAFPFVQTLAGERQGYRDGPIKESAFYRVSGLAVDENGDLFVADSENRVVRVLTSRDLGKTAAPDDIGSLLESAEELRQMGEPRWPFEPPSAARDVAGTLGEIRGEINRDGKPVWFHNGFDIAGNYGEAAYFIRDEKILRPFAAENFGTLRELVRLPTIGYIHIRLGRDARDIPFGDSRFKFEGSDSAKLSGLRIPRGTRFKAGDKIGTLNAMNHVHLIAGRSGSEINAIAALEFPGIADTRTPVIEGVSLTNENWQEIETTSANERIKVSGKIRILVRAYDQMDGNPDRRKLGVYRVGYRVLPSGTTDGEPVWTIRFDRMPSNDAVPFAYAAGSKSGYTGETVFNYIATNQVNGESFREAFLDISGLENGDFILRVYAADYFGNTASKDISIEVIK